MTAPTLARLHDALLGRFLPLLPLDADAPAYVAGEDAGVPYFGRVGWWSPHSDARVQLVLWPAAGPRSVILDQWVERRPDGEFVSAPFEAGALKLPRDRRGQVETLVYRVAGENGGGIVPSPQQGAGK